MKLCLSLFFVYSSLISMAKNSVDTTFYYTIKPIPKIDRTELEITLKFTARSDSAIAVKLFRNYYGSTDIYKYITSFEGLNGTIIKETVKPDDKLINPNATGKVELKYSISYGPVAVNGGTFAPNTSANFFHLAACQWMLVVGSLHTQHSYNVSIVSPPKGWRFYSSSGKNPLVIQFNNSYAENFSRYWGGGSQSFKQFLIESKKLKVFVSNTFKIRQSEIFDAVQKIVSYQRNLFSDYNFPFYTVTILPRENNVAGLNVKNMFMCYLKEDVTPKQMYQLMAHEMLHTWLGGKVSLSSNDNEKVFRQHWFTEGFTDYLAYKMLLDLKIINNEEFATAINRYIINIAENKYKNYTYKELVQLSDSGGYGTEATKLQYYRGALLAIDAEQQLKINNKGTVTNFIKALYKKILKDGGEVSESSFFEFAKIYGLDFAWYFQYYIIKGNTIVVKSSALGEDYYLKEELVPSFDAGFSIRESLNNEKITGIKLGSNAEKAGLKDGMQLVAIENGTRFSNAWDFNKPLIVIVKIDGVEKRIQYMPNGVNIKLNLFEIKK